MMHCGCGARVSCGAIAFVASLILGIVAAFLRLSGALVIGTAFFWVALGVAVVYLGILLLTSAFLQGAGPRGCSVCGTIPLVLAGILGTALTSALLLAFTFVATSVLGAVLTGAFIFFIALILTAVACLIQCIAGCNGE
ncbi:MAG: hypothetical protein IJE10_10200 [Clostridia bacterium]|nr:hypothetical protein [Clostridia bacterium]